MAGRQRATFQKRQREVKRLEKQRAKMEKRMAKRQEQARSRLPLEPGAQEPVPAPEFEPAIGE
jgi:hypothetical protein